MKSTSTLSRAYILAVLDKPHMYAGPNTQDLETVLLNLLNLWAITFSVECEPKEVLRKTFLEMFQTSAGAGGPSSRFQSGRYSDEQIHDFYRTFVQNVFSHQDR